MPDFPAFMFNLPSPPGAFRRLRQHRPGRAAAGPAPHRHQARAHHDRHRADEAGKREAAEYGIKFVVNPLTRENYRQVLDPLLGRGDFLLNLSVDVSSIALIKFCTRRARSISTPASSRGPAATPTRSISPSRRTNYALREEALALRRVASERPTAVLTHGANPGLVSHFVKQALLNIAATPGVNAGNPSTREEWARAGAQARRQGDPHRRARHAGRQPAEAASASSSTPGRSTASSAKAASRPSSAGARTRRSCRRAMAAARFRRGARST